MVRVCRIKAGRWGSSVLESYERSASRLEQSVDRSRNLPESHDTTAKVGSIRNTGYGSTTLEVHARWIAYYSVSSDETLI